MSADTKIVKQGYLVKKGAKRKNWKTRWFILRPKAIEYYADPMDSRPKGVIPISSTVTVDLAVGQTKPNAFQIQTKARTFFISAGNSTLRDQWITSIKQIATNLRESESSDTANQ
mmetsp:Transcript_802/g.1009  ORF Transcript_802/g.1009 Transcript_802/m.1009 type:complete len:115 (-) Transcript_802:13-357(-)